MTYNNIILGFFQFNKERGISDDSIYLRKNPTISDTMHCVLYVASADQDLKEDRSILKRLQIHLRDKSKYRSIF